MKIIDNRFKIDSLIKQDYNYESYKVIDLWKENQEQYMKIYNYDKQKELITYFTDNFIYLSQIKHEYILSSNTFRIVNSIDTKSVNMQFYYTLVDYLNAPTVEDVKDSLNLKERITIILDTIIVLEFLHFRGYTYKQLSPSNIFYTNDGKIKLMDLASIEEKNLNNQYDEFTRYFFAPELMLNRNVDANTIDYYSLGVLIKYLLLKDYLSDNVESFVYKDEELNIEQQNIFNQIISNLTNKDEKQRGNTLIDILDLIKDCLDFNYEYDLTMGRNTLIYKNRMVGRSKELAKMMIIDDSLEQGINNYKGMGVIGTSGIGKSRFLKEISYHLRLRGKNVFYDELVKKENNDLLNLTSIFKQTIKDVDAEAMEQLKGELAEILPDLKVKYDVNDETSLITEKNRYILYNKISNYISNIAKEKIHYIILDDLQNANANLLSLIDFLMNNLKTKNVFFIFSFCESKDNDDNRVKNTISRWIKNKDIIDIELHNLNLEEIAEMMKNILGMRKTPINFATSLFKESSGNPKYIESIIKNLFSRKELFIDSQGDWSLTVDGYDELELPITMDEVLDRQVELIKEKHLGLCRILAIFNEGLYKDTLFALSDLSRESSEIELKELIKLKIIDEKVADWGYSYSINSNELKKIIYEGIPDEDKRQLHKRASDVLLTLYKDNLEFIIEELVYHLILSEQLDLAVELLVGEAESSENKYGTQVLLLWEKAFSMVKNSDNPIKLKIIQKKVDICLARGDMAKLNELIDLWIDESAKLNSQKDEVIARYYRIDIDLRKGKYEEALEQIEIIDDITKEKPFIIGEIFAHMAKANYYFRDNDFNKVREHISFAIKLSAKYNIEDYMGMIYNTQGIANYWAGNIEESIDNYTKSIEYHKINKNYYEMARVYNNIGNIIAENKKTEKAMEYYLKGLEISKKYGLNTIEIHLLNNIGELYMRDFNFDIAMKYMQESRDKSLILDDKKVESIATINIANMCLAYSDYENAYKYFELLSNLEKKMKYRDNEIFTQYHDFIGNFYGFIGKIDKAIYHTKLASTACKDFSIKQWLITQSRVILYQYFIDRVIDKESMNFIREEYSKYDLIFERRHMLLYFAVIALMDEDIEYAKELLNEDSLLVKKLSNYYLDNLRKLILLNANKSKNYIDKMIKIIEDNTAKTIYNIDLYIYMIVGFESIKIGNYRQAIKYLFDSLDIIYKNASMLPDFEFKKSFVELRKVKKIKELLSFSMMKLYDKTLIFKTNELNTKEDFDDFFDISPIFNIISNDEFLKIMQISYFSEDENLLVDNIENLISNLREDKYFNLNLILKFICKESLATNGCIFSYDENTKDYIEVVRLNTNKDCCLNENLINIVNRNSQGMLVSYNNESFSRGLIGPNIKSAICIPLFENVGNEKIFSERRKTCVVNHGRSQGFIYIETERTFNRFDQERFDLISKLSNLIYLNLDNIRLTHIATMDKLTNTYTRKYYDMKFDELIENAGENLNIFSVLMLDIDRFKSINDTYGHRKGDEVLKILGSILKKSTRCTDIVGRYGGEEFVVLLKNTNEDEAMKIAEKIRVEVENTTVPGIEYPITISIGVSRYPDHSQFKDELVEKADQALYFAKESGRNRVELWSNHMDKSINRADKLAGILTGNTNDDNRNLIALIDIIDLIKENYSIKDSAYLFLGRLIETLDADLASLILLNNNEITDSYSRIKHSVECVELPKINKKIIDRVIESREGECLIDWDTVVDFDEITGLPNWQSTIFLPLISKDKVAAIVYISVSLKNKEFDFGSFNLAKRFGDIFAALL